MANVVKYNDVNWGADTPIKGERLATNGYYTGEHKGTPMQDAKNESANTPHFAEGNTVRLGTMMQDVADAHFPTVVEGE
jgi:hypothetical protein